jgi:hypothetical protein
VRKERGRRSIGSVGQLWGAAAGCSRQQTLVNPTRLFPSLPRAVYNCLHHYVTGY